MSKVLNIVNLSDDVENKRKSLSRMTNAVEDMLKNRKLNRYTDKKDTK